MHHAHKSFKSGMQEWFTIDKNINVIHHLNILIKKKKHRVISIKTKRNQQNSLFLYDKTF